MNRQLSEYTNSIKNAILLEKNDKGKAVFSNDTLRTAEFSLRTKTDEKYISLTDAIDAIRNDLDNIEINIKELSLDFKIEEILSRGE